MKTILTCLLLATGASGQISGPVTIHNPSEITLQSKVQASSFAEQWVYAFRQLKISPGISIEIVTTKDGNDVTLGNIYALSKSKDVVTGDGSIHANLLVAVQRIDKHDYIIILDPRQIRYIRQVPVSSRPSK